MACRILKGVRAAQVPDALSITLNRLIEIEVYNAIPTEAETIRLARAYSVSAERLKILMRVIERAGEPRQASLYESPKIFTEPVRHYLSVLYSEQPVPED